MRYQDEVVEGAEIVRPYMVTGGRTRANDRELPIETLVSATSHGRRQRPRLQFEQGDIIDLSYTTMSIAELAATLSLPLRSVQVLVSDLVAEGCLEPSSTVDVADIAMLNSIRSAIYAL